MNVPDDDNAVIKWAGVGLSTVLGWFFALWNGTRRKLDALATDLNEHRVHVASTYPTKPQMDIALDKIAEQITSSHEAINRRLDKIDDRIEKLRDGK